MPNLLRRRSLTSYALRPIVQYLAPASRLLTPSANQSITSLGFSPSIQPQLVLDFRSDEGRKNVREWYERQGCNTRFTLLEHRKHKCGQVKHEFVVAWLGNATLCRFDRRARNGERGYILQDQGSPAKDSVHILSSLEAEFQEVMEQTEVLVAVKLPHGEDLGVILAVCEGVQIHAKAVAYNLMRYNCYFFSWIIFAAVGRRTYDWEIVVLSQEGWNNILRASLASVFPTLNQCKNGPWTPWVKWINGRSWVSRVFPIAHEKFRNTINSAVAPSRTERLQVALLAQYSDSHDAIEKILPKLLLRSQLGPALKKELDRIEEYGLFLAKCALSVDMIIETIPTGTQCHHAGRAYHSGIPFEFVIPDNSNGEISTLLMINGPLFMNPHSGLARAPTKWQFSPRRRSPQLWVGHDDEGQENEDWEVLGHDVMEKWRNVWEECDRLGTALGTQYATTVTTAVLGTVLERLGDVPPEQLVFGDNRYLELKYDSGSGRPKDQASLQDFIRGRMQSHFEMVDKVGFGSFQELITTAEEAMCEIWVASLDIIESNRYQPQYH